MARPFQVKAIFEYSSPHEDDLNFAVGQIINVTDQEDDDWYGGEYIDSGGLKQQGIFPRNFVERYEPTAPPRPTRARPKKEPEPALPLSEDFAATTAQPWLPPKQEEALADEAAGHVELNSPAEKVPPAIGHASSPSRPVVDGPALATSSQSNAGKFQPVTAPGPAALSAVATPRTKNAAPPPPPTSEKPAGSSFKDRIAAFNKPAAPPIAPFKPGGLSGGSGNTGFIKKPFVAPPPSRNAYVPPVREIATNTAHRREEDVEKEERRTTNSEVVEKAGPAPATQPHSDSTEDQPKPTSLKERIALLQKQQMEQAQRHADAAARKEKPKKPPKLRAEQTNQVDKPEEAAQAVVPPASESREAEDRGTRTSTEEVQPARVPPTPRRKLSKGPTSDPVHDGNDADMSGAGDTTEGQDDTTERDDSDGTSLRAACQPIAGPAHEVDEVYEEAEENDDEVDPEIRRKEELRARMAKMSGGMGFHGMFGTPMAPTNTAPAKKKAPKAEATPIAEGAEHANPVSRSAPPIPTPMALPGMGGPRPSTESKQPGEEESATRMRAAPAPIPIRTADGDGQADCDDDDDDNDSDDDDDVEKKAEEEREKAVVTGPQPEAQTPKSGPPPLIGGRPARPAVPSESRPPPPPARAAEVKSATDGSESDDELSAGAREGIAPSVNHDVPRLPPMATQPLHSPRLPARSPPVSPRLEDSSMPGSPHVPEPASKRMSRPPPPPIPGSAPLPPAAHSRPPPPPPPATTGLSREGRTDAAPPMPPIPSRPPQAGDEENEENTEYEGDYDTDIGSSVPHKDALKAHTRDSSLEDNGPQSPAGEVPPTEPPTIPAAAAAAAAPRAVPPPIPWQPPPESGKRGSMDAPRAVPPPPPVKEARADVDYRAHGQPAHDASHGHRTPMMDEEAVYSGPLRTATAPERRAPPATPGGRGPQRPSMDVPRPSMSGRRSTDLHRPSMESGFIANDVDLAVQTGWWKQANQVPPVLQGRRDIHFESEESATTNQGARTLVTRTVYVLFQDYSQTVVTVRYDPHNASDVELEQRHEAPPRALRQDQMEEFHDRFGRRISEAASSKKDAVVGDGTPQGLVLELLRPLGEALWPVGTRAYGALVYSNMANASTQQHDVIRPGDIMSIRNAKFQGKHGPMHAKYSAEVGKPDHVAVVAEWDGTKKKVRAWEQGRESKKVKLESFKLDDLRSGEVKIWRVVPRGWIGWNGAP